MGVLSDSDSFWRGAPTVVVRALLDQAVAMVAHDVLAKHADAVHVGLARRRVVLLDPAAVVNSLFGMGNAGAFFHPVEILIKTVHRKIVA